MMTFLGFDMENTLAEMMPSISDTGVFDFMHSPSFLERASSSGLAVVDASENSKHGSGDGCK